MSFWPYASRGMGVHYSHGSKSNKQQTWVEQEAPCSNPSVRREQIENTVQCFSVLKSVPSGAYPSGTYPPAKLHLPNLPQRAATGPSI